MPSPSPSNSLNEAESSSRPTLLPSPFTHSDEQVDNQSASTRLPAPVEATTASIYSAGLEVQPPADGDDYPEAQNGMSLLPPSGFSGFFTMITDAGTEETYHPSTYYVFADDDMDALTTATLHALDASYSPEDAEARSAGRQTRNGEALPADEERYLVDGTHVQSAKSLAPKWAVIGAEVRHAPTFDGAEGGTTGEGLMLMVEGVGMDGAADLGVGTDEGRKHRAMDLFEEARKKGGGSVVQGMEELAQGMGSGLAVLDKIVAGTE
jgi:hypothetical protein